MKKRYKFLIGFLSIVATMSIIMSTYYIFLFFKNKPENSESQGEFLLLAIRSSGGHMTAAKAAQAELLLRGYKSDIVYLDNYDPLLMGDQYESLMSEKLGRVFLSRFISRTFWSTGIHYFGMGYDILRPWLEKGNYKCIVTFQPLTYKMVNNMIQRDNLDIPYVIVPTDWEDPQLGSGFWIAGPNAIYILGTDRLFEQCPPEYTKFKVDGMILRPEFTKDVKTQKERCEELGLPLDKPKICVMFGKCASSDMVKTALIMRDQKQYHFVFVCGSNKEIQENINSIKNEFHCDHYTVLGFVQPHKVMQASTIFIGKPGPGALSEAMVYKLPMLISENDTLLQEIYNAKRVKKLGIAEGFIDPAELTKLIPMMIENIDKYIKAYDQVPPNRALEQICNILIDVRKGKIKNPVKKINDVDVNIGLGNMIYQNKYEDSSDENFEDKPKIDVTMNKINTEMIQIQQNVEVQKDQVR